ncbi:MAG TPA: type VI secretion system baseplate subunit TssF, partial [Planctomycetota bacterium]|nr:type VI secretion system baseplate subunit TssF [Planctomycetota bacterium]
RPAGFHPQQALLPAPPISFEGFRLFQEYFAFVTKFLFVDLTGLERLKELGDVKAFEAVFELKRLPQEMPALGTASILLNCTPIVNLFEHDADPIRIDHGKLQHRIRPGGGDSSHFEVHTVKKVTGHVKGAAASREYIPFFSFSHSLTPSGKDCAFYRTHLHGSLKGDGTDVFLSFVGSDGSAGMLPPEVETISIEVLSTNRQLPSKLRLGDISAPTPTSPVFARFRNITKLTPSVPPPLGGDVYWKLIAHLGLNFRSLHHLDSLREVLRLYNFGALVDRQAEQACLRLLEGLKSIAVEPATRLLEGMPVRGVAVKISMEEDNFAGEGDMYLFASLLNEFFALYVTLNSFSQLTVKGLKHGEVYTWPPRIGDRSLL